MNPTDLVRLNVGGRKFTTSQDTLSRSGMLTALWNNNESRDYLYLDKDPEVFNFVLNIMRGDLLFDDIPHSAKWLVFQAIDYFLVPNVTEKVMYFRHFKSYDLDSETKATLGYSPSNFSYQPGTQTVAIKVSLFEHDALLSPKVDIEVVGDIVVNQTKRTTNKYVVFKFRYTICRAVKFRVTANVAVNYEGRQTRVESKSVELYTFVK